MHNLFRSQAVENRKQGLHGDILIRPQSSHSVILTALCLWVILLFIWFFTNHYARKETVVGWLEPPQGITRVYAEATGIVQKVLVAEASVRQLITST